jgi:hypothetical protein
MGRRDAKTRQELVQAEFGQSREHFRRATHHAAGGMGASFGPRLSAAKVKIVSVRGKVGAGSSKLGDMASQGWTSTVAVISPIADAAREGAARSAKLPASKGKGEKSDGGGHKTPVGLLSLIAAGAALGAAGALVARRRNRARWAEYQPDELQGDAASMSMAGEQHGATAKLAAWAKENTRTAMGTVRGKMRPSGAPTEDGDEMNERVADPPGATTKDLRNAVPGETTEPPAEAGPGQTGSMADEVDALLRASKNGRQP